MADCAYTFKGPDGNYLTVTGIHGLKAYMVNGGLEQLFPNRAFPLKAVARFSRGGVTQGDIFKDDFATKRTTVSRTEVVSSKGDTAVIKKPNVDSRGRQISTTKSGLENFWNFYKNGPVDNSGRPILLFHSTNSDIAVCEKGRVTTNNFGLLGDVETSRAGVFATPDLSFSMDYLREGEGQNIMPIFMALQNPLDIRNGLSESDEITLESAGVNVRMIYQTQNDWELFDNDDEGKNDFVLALEKAGYDGAIFSEEGQDGNQHDTYVAFHSTQIKSAIGNRGSFSPESGDIRYSKGETATNVFQNQAEAEARLREDFGPGIKNLVNNGILNFTQGKTAWPQGLQDQLVGNEEAVYYKGKAYVDLQATTKDRVSAVVLHELGEHYNLEVMLSPEGYQALQNQITNRAKIKGSQAERIWNQVKALYPELEEGSKPFVSEVIAKLGEANPNAPWYKRLLARIKAFLVERGLGRGFITGTFTENDMHELLLTSLRSASGRFADIQGVDADVRGELAFSIREKPAPKNTVKAYKLFKIKKGKPGQLFPLYVNADTPVNIGVWEDADIGATTDAGKVKSKIGPLAYRPGWHAGVLPMSSHIGGSRTNGKPTTREPDTVWAEVEMAADKDWQEEANSRASVVKSGPRKGQINSREAHITDQIPEDGYYRYKTNSNMTGDWLISGSMRVNRVLTDAEVEAINDSAGVSDLPRKEPLNLSAYGFDETGSPLAQFSRAPEERSPLWNRWFGKSKMQRGGEPIKFYHGSQAEFTVFDKNRLATATNHSTAGLGHFFTENPEEAYGYGGNVKEVFLSAQKPYITTSWLLDDKFSDAAGAAKFREKLQAEGFDSIYIKDAKYAVVFDSNQAKLTSNVSPTFGEDVRFSRAPTAVEEVEIQDSIQDSVKDTAFQLRSKLRKLSDKLFAQAYAFLSVRQMVEQSKEYMTNGHEYEELMQARRATVDSWLIKADRVVSEHWKKLSKSMRDSLANVIHASTLADTDVSKAWTGAEVLKEQPNLMRVYTQSKLSNKNQAWLASLVGGTKDKPAAEVGNGYVIIAKAHWDKVDEILDQLKVLEARQTHTRKINNWPDINAVRKERYAEAKAQYDRLSPQAQFVYTRANELHNEMFKARLKALEEQINEAVLDLATRKKLNKEFREKMESQGMSHYYAPLARYGDHWFYGTDSEGQNWYSTFESKKERDEAMEEFAKTGTIKGSGTSIKERTGVLGGETADTFIREVNDAIAKNVPGDAGVMLQDQIYKMYIDSLPDVSVRHSAMHRKGVLGFEKDAMRAFSNAMHHGASQLANMIYGRKMQDVLDTAEKALAIASSDNQVQIRKDEITAGDLLIDHWGVLGEPGYIENELKRFKEPSEDEDFVDQELRDSRFDDVTLDVWVRLREMRNKYGRLDEEQRLEALELNRDRVNQLLEMAKAIKHEDKHKVAAVISELRKTYKAMVTAGSSDMDQVAAYVKQFGFMWTLGFGLSSGLVNMLQTPVVAMPVAYGKYGLNKTVSAFGTSRNEFMRAIQNGLKRDKNGDFMNRDADGNVSMSVAMEKKLKTLPENSAEFTRLDDELDALYKFKQEGDISRTQTFDIIGIGQEGENHGGKLQDFSKMAGWMFHFGERANREITLMASYRLARDSGMDHDSAIAEARRINNLAHGDYSAENAARIFRGWPSQIALQYKKYVQMQMYLWGSSLLNAIRLIKDRNSVEGREAAKTLGGLFIMQSAFAGTMGLPLMGATAAVINAIGGMFDDEDDPFDAEEEIRLWLTENFGKEAATAIMKGGLNALTPANVGDRLSLRNIFFQEQMIEREGRDAAADYMANMFGPTGGIIRKLFESASMLNKGEGFRAAENALPKFAADTIKAIRYMSEDAQSLNHEKVKDMSEMEIMLQATGFSSSRLEELYSERNMIMKRKKAIDEYRQKLLNDAVQAEENGGEPDMDAIEAFNDKYPTKAIAKKNILQSEKRREKHRELSEGRGYSIDPKLDFLYDEYDLDESEDD